MGGSPLGASKVQPYRMLLERDPQETALKTDRQTQSRKITEAELDTETQEHSTCLQTHRHTHTHSRMLEKKRRDGDRGRDRERKTDTQTSTKNEETEKHALTRLSPDRLTQRQR